MTIVERFKLESMYILSAKKSDHREVAVSGSLTAFNPLGSKSDQRQFSPKLITKGRML